MAKKKVLVNVDCEREKCMKIIRGMLAVMFILLLTGCIVPREKNWVSDDNSLTADHWFKANAECQYDANKFSADNTKFTKLYYQCMYVKGWHEEYVQK